MFVIPLPQGELVVRCDPRTGYLRAAGFDGHDRVDLPGVPLVLQFSNGEVPVIINPSTGALTAAGMGQATAAATAGDGWVLGAFTAAERDAMEALAREYRSVVRRRRPVLALPDGELCAIMLLGQSLAQGTTSYPVLTRQQAAPDCYMLGDSVHPQNLSDSTWVPHGDPLALSPLVATVTSRDRRLVGLLTAEAAAALPPFEGNRGETPGEGFCAQFRPAWLRARGLSANPNNRWVVGSVAVASTAVEQWLDGAPENYFNRARDFYRAVKACAAARGLKASAPIILIANGESSPNEEFGANLARLIEQLRALVAEEFPDQRGIVPVFLQQTGGTYTSTATRLAQARGQIAVSNTVPGVFIVSNSGAYPDKAPANTHLTANGSRWLGCQAGKVATRVLADDVGWQCTRALGFRYRGDTLLGWFHTPVPPLTWGAHFRGLSQPPRPDSAGLRAEDDAGWMELSAARIVGPSTIAWTLSRAVVGQLTVTIGWQENGDGAPIYIADGDETQLAATYEYLGDNQLPEEDIPGVVGLRYDARNLCLADRIVADAA
ncbi:hypothetical protein [Falsiroseomonas ponticola]|uniref:hypothetical protein n=1 Tax=Falsiroseomonas ponticola TaxID=2786951 RepID=UPI0019317556|nr:hypothetical protein [Roseomonas ponticola]